MPEAARGIPGAFIVLFFASGASWDYFFIFIMFFCLILGFFEAPSLLVGNTNLIATVITVPITNDPSPSDGNMNLVAISW